MRVFACGLGLSLLFHLGFLFVLIFDFSQKKSDLGGFEAQISDDFQSVMIVSNLPKGEIKEFSQPSQKALKSAKQAKKAQNQKRKFAELKDEKSPEFEPLKKDKQQDLEQNSQEQSQNSQQSSINSAQNQALKDNFTSGALMGESKITKSAINGANNAKIKSYQGLIMAHLNKHKKYPPQAISQEKQGVVSLKISIDKEGNVLLSSIKRGSGELILDEEALNLLKRANPLPKPPPNMLNSSNTLNFSIPINYNIKEFLRLGR